MNHTGVTSTGSRRQALRNRLTSGFSLRATGFRDKWVGEASRRHGITEYLKSGVWNLKPAEGLIPNRRVEQLAGERDELFEPERLVTKLGTKFSNFVRLRIVQIVIARHNRDRGPR